MQETSFDHPAAVNLDYMEHEGNLLEAALPYDLRERFRRYVAVNCRADAGRVAHGLALHFVGLAPAILAVSEHLINDDWESGCCGRPTTSAPQGAA